MNLPFSHICGVALQMSLFPVYSGCENSRLGHRSTLEEGPTHSYTHTHHPYPKHHTYYHWKMYVCIRVQRQKQGPHIQHTLDPTSLEAWSPSLIQWKQCWEELSVSGVESSAPKDLYLKKMGKLWLNQFRKWVKRFFLTRQFWNFNMLCVHDFARGHPNNSPHWMECHMGLAICKIYYGKCGQRK